MDGGRREPGNGVGAVAVARSSESERLTDLTDEARERVRGVDSSARKVDDRVRECGLEPGPAPALGLVVDSLSRSADYGGNIAEKALQTAAPAPWGESWFSGIEVFGRVGGLFKGRLCSLQVVYRDPMTSVVRVTKAASSSS